MTRALAACCIAALALLPVTSRAQNESRPAPAPTIQGCMSVPVELLDAIDSAHAKPGDFFRFRTIDPVRNEGNPRVLIPAHTTGYGVVALAVQAGAHGKEGALLLQPLYLKMPDGSQLGVVLDYGMRSLGGEGKSTTIPGYLGVIPVFGLGIAIGAVNYFIHGKNVTIQKGTKFTIFAQNDPQTAFCQP